MQAPTYITKGLFSAGHYLFGSSDSPSTEASLPDSPTSTAPNASFFRPGVRVAMLLQPQLGISPPEIPRQESW